MVVNGVEICVYTRPKSIWQKSAISALSVYFLFGGRLSTVAVVVVNSGEGVYFYIFQK